MKLGIISDTHNELSRTQTAIRLLQAAGVEGLVHCGDLSSPTIVYACAVLPFWFVFGNHDADNVPALQEAALASGAVCLGWAGQFQIDGRLIAVTHGHMTYDVRRALKLRPNYLLTGHTHIASDRNEGVVRRVNPGAIFEADPYSVALLDLDLDELRFLQVPATDVIA